MTNEMMYKTFKKLSGHIEGWSVKEADTACFGQLFHCKAWLYGVDIDNKRYMVLKSYNTVVAVWDVEENVIIDALRAVYGYTNTSAQHISKFVKWVTARRINSKPTVYRVREWNKIEKVAV